MNRLTPRALFALLCIVLAAGVLSACGGDSGDEDVDEVLAQTFGAGSEDVQSGRLRVRFQLDAQGLEQLPGPLRVDLRGPFASGDDEDLPRFDFTLALGAAGQTFSAGAVSTGDAGFLRLMGRNFEVGDQLYAQFQRSYRQAQQRERKDDGGGGSFKALGIDPRRWLTDARNEGTEEVGGAETIHIAGGIDVPKLLADLNKVLGQAGALGVTGAGEAPQKLSAQQRRLVAQAVRSAEVDLWTGEDDKILRKIAVTVAFETPQGEREAAGGLEQGAMRLELVIADVNEDQEIEAPDDARPLSELTGAPGGAIPGLGGGAGGASGSNAYLECLDAAGDDVAKIQRCSAELSP